MLYFNPAIAAVIMGVILLVKRGFRPSGLNN